jgi:hypothetical protein
MKRIEKFEVPAHFLAEFIDEAIAFGFAPKSKSSTSSDYYQVSIAYDEDEDQESIDELDELLSQVEDQDEDQDEDED